MERDGRLSAPGAAQHQQRLVGGNLHRGELIGVELAGDVEAARLGAAHADAERAGAHRFAGAAPERASRPGAAVDPATVLEPLERDSAEANSGEHAPLDDDEAAHQDVAVGEAPTEGLFVIVAFLVV